LREKKPCRRQRQSEYATKPIHDRNFTRSRRRRQAKSQVSCKNGGVAGSAPAPPSAPPAAAGATMPE
jgi:hypothetical protein